MATSVYTKYTAGVESLFEFDGGLGDFFLQRVVNFLQTGGRLLKGVKRLF